MGKLSNVGSRLASPPPRLRPPPKVAEQFYTSVAWRTLVASIKRERGALCQACGSSQRIIGDHIVERKDGGADLDRRNIMLLCHACHQRKTAHVRAKRARGQT